MIKKKIEVWLMSTYFNKEIPHYRRFYEEQSLKMNIEIDMKVIAWNKAYEMLIDAFKNNHGPDLFEIGSTWVSTFVNLGYLSPIPKDFLQKKYIANWLYECSVHNNQQYAIPWFSEPHILMGNNRIIQEYSNLGHEAVDWKTFYNHCNDISTNSKKNNISISPFSFLVKSDLFILHTFFAWLYKSGFSFPSQDKVQMDFLDVKLMEETFRYIFSLINIGKSENIPNKEVADKYGNEHGMQHYSRFYDLQQSAFITSSGVNVIADTLRKLNAGTDATQPYGVYTIPHKDQFQLTNGGGVLLGISKSSEKRQEVFELAHEMMQPKFLEAWMLESGNLPAFEHELWTKYESNNLIASVKAEISNAKSYPFHPLWRNIERILADGISSLFWDLQANKINDNQIAERLQSMNHKINEMIYVTWNRR